MKKEICLKYRWIKKRRQEVFEFLETEFWLDKDCNSNTQIENDLGITGDDADELICKYEKRFCVNMDELKFDEYFHSEGEFSNTFPLFVIGKIALIGLAIIILPISYKNAKEVFLYTPFVKSVSSKKALTIGDLIASTFTKKFTLREDVIIKLV